MIEVNSDQEDDNEEEGWKSNDLIGFLMRSKNVNQQATMGNEQGDTLDFRAPPFNENS